MKLESVGLLISMQPFGERDSIARVFSVDFGVLSGMMRGAQSSRRNKPLIGQIGTVSWNARLDSQLGTFHWEAEKNLSACLMGNQEKLSYMNSAFSLIATLVPEREQYSHLYLSTVDLLNSLNGDDASGVYLRWEISLLEALGYALDLKTCSGCGTHDDLKFLSPRTGRAVCATCAKPYINKLYRFPVDLNVTMRFLERACMEQGTELPIARKFLMSL